MSQWTLIYFNFYRHRSPSPPLPPACGRCGLKTLRGASCRLCLRPGLHFYWMMSYMCHSERRSLMRAVTLSGSYPAMMKSSRHLSKMPFFSLTYGSSGCTTSCKWTLATPTPKSSTHTLMSQTHTYSAVKQQHNTGSYLGFVCNLFGRFVRQAQWY